MGNKNAVTRNQSLVRMERTIFDIKVPNYVGNQIPLSEFKGRNAYLIVNVASQWGLTNQNYKELQELYQKYNTPDGLEILAFPCNNFGAQEPGTNAEVQEFAKRKGATFPILGKVECENGTQTHPLFQYIKDVLPGGLLGTALKWNFSKILCNKYGEPIQRYLPTTNPLAIENDIKTLLAGVDTFSPPSSKSETTAKDGADKENR